MGQDETKPEERQRAPISGGATLPELPGLAARGLCMGTADVVPGVSGGTMALILGIYSRLILAIKSIDKTAATHLLSGRIPELLDHVHWKFLAAVVCGQAAGIAFFTTVVPLPTLIQSHPELVYGLFFGLIVGSIGILGRSVVNAGLNGARIAAGVAGLLFGLGVVNLIRTETPEAPWFVFLAGCVSICAMILPGISGSFVLLILRKYAYVLGALGQVIHPGEAGRVEPFLTVVLPFACGCLLGLLSFARLLSALLTRAEHATFAFMTGLMGGSLWVVWPFQDRVFELIRKKQRLVSSTPMLPESADAVTLGAFALMGVGIVAVLGMEAYAGRAKPSSIQ
jgi:putative membrane protein